MTVAELAVRLRIRERFQAFRDYAYRLKYRYVLSNKWYRGFITSIWPSANVVGFVDKPFKQTVNLFQDLNLEWLSTELAKNEIVENTEQWEVQEEFVIEVDGDIVLEPRFSLALVDGRYLVEETRGQSHFELRPAFASRPSKTNTTKLGPLIHFDGFVGRNLFHFFYESLNALLLLEERGFLRENYTLVIHEDVYQHEYVRRLIEFFPSFATMRLHVQKRGEFLRTTKMVKGSPSFEQYPRLYGMLSQRVDKRPSRKIFLDRASRYGRRVVNFDQIRPAIEQRGFETVLAENLSYEEQIRLFTETEYLIALHGAGMTNTLFSDMPRLKVLELNSIELANPCYFWLSNMLGASYHDVLYGSGFDRDWNYSIDPQEFDMAIDRLMAA